jgi:hypothetical protein
MLLQPAALPCSWGSRRICVTDLYSENEDPTVRGLALRSLCSLRLESVLEYIQLPLHKSLTDISAYVRKTGVMGILKVSRQWWLSLNRILCNSRRGVLAKHNDHTLNPLVNNRYTS